MWLATGSPVETVRVGLFSMAHARHAPMLANEPHGTSISGRPIQDRHTPPAAISDIPDAMRASKLSLNTNHARNAARTPSRFNSNEALDAGVADSPHINRIRPTTRPAATARARR